MCAPDPNAGIRYQAKLEKQKKDQKFHSDSLKYWNREVSAKQRSGALTTGLSRARSDAYSKAVWTLGQGRQATQEIYKEGARLSRRADKTGVSRASRYMAGKYREILDKQSNVERMLNATFGRNMDTVQQGIYRRHQNLVAKNRQKLGVRPEYGSPVMMPPKDRQGQMFNSISMGLSIASLGITLAKFLPALGLGSDIRLKQNIRRVGKSPTGYSIYEWEYKSDPETRYRGAIAQDVLKLNPMAVGIRKDLTNSDEGYFFVDYSKIDIDMEVVS